MTATAAPAPPPAPAGKELLAAVRANRVTARAVEVERAELVLAWVREAEMDAEEITAGTAVFDPEVHAGVPGTEEAMRLAGPGAPLVSDLGFVDLAAALGQSNEAAMGYVGAVVELAYRLPRLWLRVRTGQVSVHRARTVARMTKRLPEAGAAWVDAQMAWTIGTCSLAQIERTVTAAMQTYDPEQAEREKHAALEGRRVDIHLGDVATDADPSAGAVVAFAGGLDLADALDLEAAIAARAAALKAVMPHTSDDVRRSIALGDLARGPAALPVVDAAGDASGARGQTGATAESPRHTGAAGRAVMLYLHLSADALRVGPLGAGVGRCENTRSPVTSEQVRTWCGTAGRVLVRPVIDLNDQYSASGYEAGPRLREQVILRDQQCCFPFCHRSARSADLDHITPHGEGGATDSRNLAALCRRHHRAKTHTAWAYEQLSPGTYHWRAPDGSTLLVTAAGTFLLPSGPGQPVLKARRAVIALVPATGSNDPPPF